MNTSTESTLKTYIVTRGEKRGTLNVECPSRKCRGKFIVSRRWENGYISDGGKLYMTSSCPYCYRTAWRTAP